MLVKNAMANKKAVIADGLESFLLSEAALGGSTDALIDKLAFEFRQCRQRIWIHG